MLFTSESVTQGHPDKMADQISDAVLDAVLAQDPRGRVACETLLKTGFVALAGELTSTCHTIIAVDPSVATASTAAAASTRAIKMNWLLRRILPIPCPMTLRWPP